VLIAALVLAGQAADAGPVVKCVLVLPPGAEPWAEARERLDAGLKDAQWWYACQMEALGYGAKTFALETDEKGKVVVHVAHVDREPELPPGTARTEDAASGARSGTVLAAERVVGNPRARKGSVMVLAYDGYYWTDRAKLDMLPMGFGLSGRWAHLSGWHLYGLNAKLFTEATPVPSLPETNRFFPPLATRVYQAWKGDGTRSVGERASCSLGSFLHEMGHSFGLHHPGKGDPRIPGDVMTGDYWNVRGNFVAGMPEAWCCLTPAQAAELNKSPLFRVRKVARPSTGASRTLGAKGAFDPAVAFRRGNFAAVDLVGEGFVMAPLGRGRRSHANRDYVWKDLPGALEGFAFTQTAGGQTASITARALGSGRIYVATAAEKAGPLLAAGWQIVPPTTTLAYASADGKRTYRMYLYSRDVTPREVVEIPQCEWSGTVVIGPGR
jgi:hypothetical protein